MKELLLFLSLFISVALAHGQSMKLPVQKYSSGHTLEDFFQEIGEEENFKKLSLFYGVQPTFFLNPRFFDQIKNEEVKIKYGHVGGVKYMFYPFIADLNYFETFFQSDEIGVLVSDTASVRHRGFEGSLSVVILPTTFRLTRHVMPNIGAGYQSSQLAIFKNDKIISSNKAENLLSSTNTSALIWRFGIIWNLGTKVFLSTDYKQSLMLNHEKAFHQFSLSLGIRGL
ncbi:MAG: hypothetical protein IPH04_19260 [Saprospirales bacterium]|nr:hypothetical protein [Saprospirales bacterium]